MLDKLFTELQLSVFPHSTPRSLPDTIPHLLVSLGLFSTTIIFMRRFFGRLQGRAEEAYLVTEREVHKGPLISGIENPDPDRSGDYVMIKHGTKEYMVSYPVDTIISGSVTVGAVRDRCVRLAGVEPEGVSLSCGGRILRDDAAPLRSLGIGHAARILCVASKAPVLLTGSEPAATVDSLDGTTPSKSKKKRNKKKARPASPLPPVPLPPSPTSPPQPEVGKLPLTPRQQIEAVWEEIVANLHPLVNDFLQNPPADADKRADTHRRLTETMMGALLKLDSVESGEPEVRARRKEVVKQIQGTFDNLDAVLRSA
ncbi:hypothetical protein C7212DRAFT_325956 [Tuber magnatum]|uniref:BAG domain-containing protein n=1 Tax=Tuber magnatum TaxID=42249 RepID=A0A317SN52_9PEZI|nr:hypothetical protein C7212DRAFT_325956 [Tuber magnatum]